MVPVFYSPRFVGAAHAFDTTRKAAWIAESLDRDPIAGLERVEPTPLTRDHILSVHDPAYVRAVETGQPRDLAESQGFSWDPGLWSMVLSSNGGAVAAALAALEHGIAGSLSSGLHHARHASGAGFCTFNGLVIAAREAVKAGARSVLILDLDAHCGGGTASLIAHQAELWQADVSVSGVDAYSSSERAWLDLVREGSDYLPTIRRRLRAIDQQGPSFDLCLYNAGMDPCEDCPMGGLSGVDREVLRERERLVFEWCLGHRLPIAFVLAGGYVGPDLDASGVVALHRLTLSQAAASDSPRDRG